MSEPSFIPRIIDWNPIVNSYLVICNVKKLTIENKLVKLSICLLADCIEVDLLPIVHLGSIAEVFFDEPFVVPSHICPDIGNIWILSELSKCRIRLIPVPVLVILDVLKAFVYVKPVS